MPSSSTSSRAPSSKRPHREDAASSSGLQTEVADSSGLETTSGVPTRVLRARRPRSESADKNPRSKAATKRNDGSYELTDVSSDADDDLTDDGSDSSK